MSPVPDRPSPARSRAASGAAATGPPVSDDRITGALDTNLAQTAVEVVVPAEHLVLLDISSGWYGIHRATEELLREVHHRYASWPQTLADVHRRATSDFHYYNRHERGPEALSVYCDIYARVLEEATEPTVRTDAVRLWVKYLEVIATRSGERWDRNVAVLRAALARLAPSVEGSPELAVAASSHLRRLARALQGLPGAADRPVLDDVLGILGTALREVYRTWASRADPVTWYREVTSTPAADPVPEPIVRISHARLRDHLRELTELRAAGAREHAPELLSLPDDREIVHSYLDAAQAIAPDADSPSGLLPRIHWLLRLLEQDGLEAVSEPALRELNSLCSGLMTQDAGERPQALLRELFALLRRADLPRSLAVTELVGSVGALTVGSGDPDLVAVLVNEVSGFDFDYSGFSGFTSEWGVRVSPAHLRSVRMYLRMIEADPLLASPLIAALVVHLRLGGVFIHDTDLFQRDISSLLGCEVGPVYLLVKQLLKVFPVYFNQIGAEGELRASSTRLDEIEERRDPLCHFLRKQSHVECNPLLAPFADAIFRFWVTGDPAPLGRFIPEEVMEDLLAPDRVGAGTSAVAKRLAEREGGVDRVLALEPADVDIRLGGIPDADPIGREKVSLLFRVRREIQRKYALDHADALHRLRQFHRVDPRLIGAMEEALGRDQLETALDALLSILERLQEIILSPGPVEASEDIYFKRHIAVGIPSMYGSYREDRFEAAGLSFRLESLAGALFERVIADEELGALDRDGLRAVARWLHLLLRALRIDGYRAQGLAHCLSMLDQAVETDGVTVDQYVNIFQLTSRSIETLVRARILDAYEDPTRRIVGRMLERGVLAPPPSDGGWATLKISETFLRDLIAESLGLQRLDVLAGRVLGVLRGQRETRPRRPGAQQLDLDSWIVPFGAGEEPRGGIISLGNKGFMLARLLHLGFRVPSGFALTTELARHPEGLARAEGVPPRVAARIRDQVARLERLAGRRLGDTTRPLLLSVRGGAPVSMPGMLESFLNVGINQAIAEGMAARPRYAWAAWDSYRRFLQFWGMSLGLGRHLFDELMADAKRRHGVPKKALLEPLQMQELAQRYRALLDDHGLQVIDDPFEQLLACIGLVHRSWHSEHARLYRRALHIAEEWETGVLVQKMVFGNLDVGAGTGVLLTRHPRHESGSREPYGDFVVQGQGDDVVAGLVETHPITESQRRREATHSPLSLERDFPAIYGELAAMARTLVQDHGMNHQEIEFTFESPRPADLFILQTRDTVLTSGSLVPTFAPSPALEAARIAAGVGVGGGALSGRAAHTAHDVAELRRRHPGDDVILLRRDTVPDDIPLMLHVNGLLTSLGGATSHAAVAAKRVGKTCVVGCRPLRVSEREGRSTIGDHDLATGDRISIDGMDGSVYLGAHPIAAARVRGRAQQ